MMYSKVFTHNATRKRGLCCRPMSVCLSVCLHVRLTRSYIVSRRPTISSDFFPVATSFKFFLSQSPTPAFKGILFSGGVKYTGVGKFCDFLTEIAVYPRNYTRWVHSYYSGALISHMVTDRSVSVPMTLSDLERQEVRGQIVSDGST